MHPELAKGIVLQPKFKHIISTVYTSVHEDTQGNMNIGFTAETFHQLVCMLCIHSTNNNTQSTTRACTGDRSRWDINKYRVV